MKNKYSIIYIITLCIILILVGATFAKFNSQIKAVGYAVFAKPIFKVSNQDLAMINAKDSTGKYYFQVTNQENGKTSDVDFLYKVKIENELDNSITFKLYKDNQIIKLENNTTEPISIQSKDKQTHNYTLEIKYDKNLCVAKEDIIGKIKINIEAHQNI